MADVSLDSWELGVVRVVLVVVGCLRRRRAVWRWMLLFTVVGLHDQWIAFSLVE